MIPYTRRNLAGEKTQANYVVATSQMSNVALIDSYVKDMSRGQRSRT